MLKTAGTESLMVAGLAGGSGKSVVAVSLIAALVRRGHRVAVFKKGPDYIDAGWLALAAGRPCYNLDPYLMTPELIQNSFVEHGRDADLAIIEGNRGLFDGFDLEGSTSSAGLARLLKLPTLLVVDCTKATRTVAAQVLGCRHFDSELDLKGVVLNRVGGSRHENIVRQAVEQYTDLSVLGAFPRSRRDVFPQRHLGVTPAAEHQAGEETVADLAHRAEKFLDLEKIVGIMRGNVHSASAPPSLALVSAFSDADVAADTIADVGTTAAAAITTVSAVTAAAAPAAPAVTAVSPVGAERRIRIGYLRDVAFQFYYPDNLAALVAAGAELVAINALRDKILPPLDGLYIGGGFPETSALHLAANVSFRESVRKAAFAGLPIYAECGGLIYLGESIAIDDREYPLVGVFPVRFGLARKPQAHGYTKLVVRIPNPYYSVGTVILGHEFRYSTVERTGADPAALVFTMDRGVGFSHGRDGLSTHNVLALYTHIHALGTPEWASALVARSANCRRQVWWYQ